MPKTRKGESNPRYLIVIQVGAGMMFCGNCDHLISVQKQAQCVIFREKALLNLEFGHYGAKRCVMCLNAGKELERLKEVCRLEGRIAEVYRLNADRFDGRKS